MASTATSLYDLAAELLTVAAGILAATPSGAPAAKYVSQGPPAIDCPNQLTVHAGLVAYAQDLSRGGRDSAIIDPRFPVVPMVPLTITAMRCVSKQAMPSGGVQMRDPQLTAIQADAKVCYIDAWSLFNGLRRAQREGTLFAGYPCRKFDIGGVIPLAPEGGALGNMVTLEVQLDGYDADGVPPAFPVFP